ncbi:SDR family NAD(P)-dependent oxidoreductase [Nonomuraea sp. H19]|uniref:SDR family NAD(P)-dependent oxidoreductase n=1 Tax=Nonomuraea sp. H19 TaxID=3452206 RepID=UPI003F8B3039
MSYTHPGSLAGKVVIVTGSGRGVGRGIARTLARNGARLLLTDILADAVAGVREGADRVTYTIDLTGMQTFTDYHDLLAAMARGEVAVNTATTSTRTGTARPTPKTSALRCDDDLRLTPWIGDRPGYARHGSPFNRGRARPDTHTPAL